jgi:hypothetical protein
MNIFLIGIAFFAALVLGYYLRKLIEYKESLEKQISELKEIADRRKLPYPAQAGLEDAIAIVIDILNNEEANSAYRNTRFQQLAERIKQVRSNPQHYDTQQPDKPPRKER